MTFYEGEKRKKVREKIKKQVTRGHNIVADGWAGASNPQPHPNHIPKPPQTHSHAAIPTAASYTFFAFSTRA